MKPTKSNRTRRRRTMSRRGALAVEFAVLAPVLLVILFGLAEASKLVNVQNQLTSAAREGARMAALDRNDLVGEGESTNDKIISDVTNFLDAAGVCVDELEVEIVDADNPDLPFNLDDPANDLGLFTLRVKLPYTSINSVYPDTMTDAVLSAEVTFRNARAPMLVE